MKLSNETLTILKNFAGINQGILFRKGKTLRTLSPQRNLAAEASIVEDIPAEFGVYDLNNFLSVLTIHKDDPVIEFDSSNILISGLQGRSKIKYRFCSPNMIHAAPEKPITMPDPEICFDLKQDDFDWIMKAVGVLSSTYVSVESDGDSIFFVAFDLTNDAAHTDSLEISKSNGDKYKMIFKVENLKLISGDYEVKISSKGISNFRHKGLNLQYWVATEAGSKYEKG